MKIKINGCDTGTYSRTEKKCRKCMHKEYCENKKMELETYIRPKTNIAASTMNKYGLTVDEATEVLTNAMGNMFYFKNEVKRNGEIT